MVAYQPQCLPVNWLQNRRHFAPGYYISLDVDIVCPDPDTIFDFRHSTVGAYPSMIDFGVAMIDPANQNYSR